MTSIRLRADITGHDRRCLSATVDGDGDLVLSGQDLGPRTSMVSSGGEYEILDHRGGGSHPSTACPAGSTRAVGHPRGSGPGLDWGAIL